MNRPDPPVLIFDGDCGICTRLSEAASRWVRPPGAVRASQTLDLASYGLTQEQCFEALQFVDARGRIHAAQNAVARFLLASPVWWRPLGALLLVPGVNQLAGLGYRWVARNRYRLPGGTPACAVRPPGGSPSDSSPGGSAPAARPRTLES